MNTPAPPVLGLAGWSGSGKTTLGTELIRRLSERGLRISTLKHAHHAFDIDQPGKDSYRHRAAGAGQVLVTSANRWALMTELRGAAELSFTDALSKIDPCDLVLVEGFKNEDFPKLEVHRPTLGKPLLYGQVPGILAIASDAPLGDKTDGDIRSGIKVPILDLNDLTTIERWVLDYMTWPS